MADSLFHFLMKGVVKMSRDFEKENEYIDNNEQTPQEDIPKKEKSAVREMWEWVQAIVIAVVLALLVRNFVFNVVKVDGESMESTLHHRDRMIVWRLGYEPKQGDIVVFKNTSTSDNYWIKRIIATEGQHVEIDFSSNSVIIDGEKLDEPYNNDCMCNTCNLYGGDDMIDMGFNYTELTVPEGCVFVMGDNRNHSRDGRSIGPVSKNDLLGKAVLRFWPFSDITTY